jgi:hypothetical protein
MKFFQKIRSFFFGWDNDPWGSNWGYSTPEQKRFKPKTKVRFTDKLWKNEKYNPGDVGVVWENGRHDYLVDGNKGWIIVYQYEIEEIKK